MGERLKKRLSKGILDNVARLAQWYSDPLTWGRPRVRSLHRAPNAKGVPLWYAFCVGSRDRKTEALAAESGSRAFSVENDA